MKNSWKIITILILVGAVGLIAAAAIFNWQLSQFISLPDSWLEEPPPAHQERGRPAEIENFISIPGGYITALLAGFVIMYLIPQRIKVTAERLSGSWKERFQLMLGGLLVNLLLIGLSVGALLSFGTIPIILLLILAFVLSSWMGYIALSYRLGKFFQKKTGWFQQSPLSAYLAGHTVFFALFQIPVINLVFIILLISLGNGSAIATHFGTNQPWSLSVLKEG